MCYYVYSQGLAFYSAHGKHCKCFKWSHVAWPLSCLVVGVRNDGVAGKIKLRWGQIYLSRQCFWNRTEGGEMFHNPVCISETAFLHSKHSILHTWTRSAWCCWRCVTVYGMWLKMLIHVLTFFPHSVLQEFVLGLMALTMIGSIWPRLPALPLPKSFSLNKLAYLCLLHTHFFFNCKGGYT